MVLTPKQLASSIAAIDKRVVMPSARSESSAERGPLLDNLQAWSKDDLNSQHSQRMVAFTRLAALAGAATCVYAG